MQKLGLNHGGYHGETIDIRAVLRDVQDAARSHGWSCQPFHQEGDHEWLALHRPPVVRTGAPAPRIYVSAGIHGDEPAGPLAALQLIRENSWPAEAEVFLLPCLNPVGFTLNRRTNAGGLDLNRDYRSAAAAETRAHIAWLERQQGFDLYLCLHEDWESHGFYLYEQNPDGQVSLAETIIAAAGWICPVDPSEIIEGRAARHGIIRLDPSLPERPDWPEGLYLIHHGSRLGCTLEAPSDFPLSLRVRALVQAVTAASAGKPV